MSEALDGLFFSEDALSNRALFLSALNDINIFVEDVGKEYEYEEIFERLFGGEITIFSIFPLGGKDAVIRRQQENSLQDSNEKVNIFIVDGDFDNLWIDQRIVSENLIYLTRYNIESYYCCNEAVIKYMRSYLKCTREMTVSKIQLEQWKRSFKEEAGKLFTVFALVKRHCPQLPNVKTAEGRFLGANGRTRLDELQKYIETVSSEVGPIDHYIEEVQEKIHSEFDGIEEDKILSIICGKYQFESLCRHLTTCCHKNINRENFRNALISSFDLGPLYFLRDKIMQLVTDSMLAQSTA